MVKFCDDNLSYQSRAKQSKVIKAKRSRVIKAANYKLTKALVKLNNIVIDCF